MKENEPLNPMNVRFLGSVTVVPGSDRLADLIEELGFR
jgi:hypothetical protein